MAARVHDSVLQTLALVQREAGDPRRVAALARRQERELRAWLYPDPRGRRAQASPSAIDAAAAEVEELHGVPVELVRTGDVPLDDRVEALVLAAREAMANAARHSGADQVSAFVDVGEDEIAVFVRDRGGGFDPEAVPADAHADRRVDPRPDGARAAAPRAIDLARRGHRGRAAPRGGAHDAPRRARRRPRPLPRRRARRARRRRRDRRRGRLGRRGGAADPGARPGRRPARRPPARRRRPRGDRAGRARAARRALPRAVRLGRGRGRDRRDPRRRARLRDEDDLGRRADRRRQRGPPTATRSSRRGSPASSSTRSAPARPPSIRSSTR